MAVAVKNTPEAGSRGPLSSLPVASLVGVVYVLVSLAVILAVIPNAWETAIAPGLKASGGIFLNATLLVLTIVAAGVGLVIGGLRLMGPQPIPGLKAGIFVGLVGVLLIAGITKWASLWFEHWAFDGFLSGSSGRTIALALTAVVGLGLLVLAGRFFFKPGFGNWLVKVEEQGWFSVESYKRSQGVRVRRGTILGILILVAAGLFTLLTSRRLDTMPTDLTVQVPFTGNVTIEHLGNAEVVFKDHGLDPQIGTVMDRYTFRQLNQELAEKYVKISDPGIGNEFEQDQVVPKEKFEKIVETQEQKIAKLQAEAKQMKEAVPVDLRYLTKEREASDLRTGMPKKVDPEPAGGKTTFATLTLLPAVKFTLPLIVGALALWIGWRIVNLPVFADFLIATEAEMNKVSWTTRRRLVQDTIVVLTAVTLMTIFLLIADVVWGNLLKTIGVLRIGGGDESGEVQEEYSPSRTRPW